MGVSSEYLDIYFIYRNNFNDCRYDHMGKRISY